MMKMAALDIETTGLTWRDRMLCISGARVGPDGAETTLFLNTGFEQRPNLFGLGFGDEAEERDRAIVPLSVPEARAELWAFLEGAECLVFHNASFDLPYIVRLGLITMEELDRFLIFDTMVMARCTGPHERVGLAHLVAEYKLSTSDVWQTMKGQRTKLASALLSDVKKYAIEDAVVTLRLAQKMYPQAAEIYPDGQLIKDESDWIKLVSGLRFHGIAVDVAGIQRAKSQTLKDMHEITKRHLIPFGIKSPSARKDTLKWVASLGQTDLLRKTDKGNPSIDEESLRRLTGAAVPVVEKILAARSLEKVAATWLGGYIDHAGRDGRVHPLYTVSGTISNRLSCREPNAQAVPKKLFGTVFTARPGFRLVQLDYSQAELRIAAMFAKEGVFARELADPNADLHMATAKLMFGENADADDRQKAKSSNFLTIYGGGPQALSDQAGIPYVLAQQILRSHRKALPALAATSKEAEKAWLNRGYLKVLGGKRVYASQSDLERSYKAFNALIQSSVAELMKRAMLAVAKEMPQVLQVGQVHDSILAEIRDDVNFEAVVGRIGQIMSGAVPDWLTNRTTPPILMRVDWEVIGG